ncbi:MAG TPA: LpqB family beta-propeller domain-containing protein [Blastocatellia bacterium]|nr:LpqB family beta-propeller domain-containing protein [Blastocatellia bacterium]HNG32307.1 LpqB family beta-propeller domain-containing protein [Blastocatellia bacterium]
MKRSLLHRLLVSVCLFALLLPAPVFAQQSPPKKFELTVDSIMRANDLVGYEPARPYWSQDGRRVYFRWKRAGEARLKEPDLYVVNRDGSGLRKLTEDEAKQAPPVSGELSKDKRLTVFAEEGDIFLYDHTKNERRQLISTTEGEGNPRFAADQKHVLFTRQNNLYSMALDGGGLVQLTDVRAGGGAPEPAAAQRGIGGGFGSGQRQGGGNAGGAQTGQAPPTQAGTSQDFIKKEERELLEAVRERAQNREEQEAKRKAREKRKPFTPPTGQAVGGLSLSPNGKQVLATVFQTASGAKNTIVPNYVTESAYTEDIPGRSKVGDAQGRNRLAILSVETGEAVWVEHGLKQAGASQAGAQSPQTPDQAQGQQQQSPRAQRPQERDRDVQLMNAQWSEDGNHAVMMARAADNKDRWVMAIDPATGKTKTLDHLHDDAWVGGPGSFTLGWLPDNKTIYFQSERDGWAHLYTVSVDGGEPKQLTSGKFEVSDVRLSEDKTKFFFTSSEGSPFERHLYSMPVVGGARTRITTMAGNNDATISPDETMLAIIRSYSNRPSELYLAPSKPNAAASEIKQVTTSPTEEWLSHNWIDPPIVTFKARDGADVPARLYKPANWQKGGPAVFFVHGAGYLQNVHKWWSSYFREYMFHHLLMERGYLVMDVDYRASAGYGRDWRTGIYRHMGGKDLTDHVDAAKWLVAEHGVDPKRIGLYGGSYGGFITLMAMFTEADVFAAGAALRPVTDWAHYNHGYTANILNPPQNDAESYKQSSPIYFAQGLKGALLICHGVVDVNVHFQDSVRLAQRLIELRKENWELAMYPVEDHGFVQPTSWADEYKRILKLFETNLKPAVAPAATATEAPKRKSTR